MVGVAKVLSSISECLFDRESDTKRHSQVSSLQLWTFMSVLRLGVQRLVCPCRLVVADPLWRKRWGLRVVAFRGFCVLFRLSHVHADHASEPGELLP